MLRELGRVQLSLCNPPVGRGDAYTTAKLSLWREGACGANRRKYVYRELLWAGPPQADGCLYASSAEDVGVNHRGLHAPVPQELLDCSDVVTAHEEMSRKGVAEGMAGRVLGDADL